VVDGCGDVPGCFGLTNPRMASMNLFIMRVPNVVNLCTHAYTCVW